MSDIARRIADHLLGIQRRELLRDGGHGYRSARQIAQAMSLPKPEARAALEEMATAGTVRRTQFINGLFWRSPNPLPWEPGGKWPESH